ncbi:uncharacterized protein LOC128547739 [Mercenaria mercenaria]|uniref:uncharacterized protein LOC128547739 n=1 Tax=Mercenaria mercenaria TaxID=6596 RepID=UPI00234F832C|nr:uncharacterized protein LOC128547739 [Mercenaria mercenaria]
MEVSGKKTEEEQDTSSTASEHKSLEAAIEITTSRTNSTKENEDTEFKDSPATKESLEVEQRLEEYSLKTTRSVDERNKAFTADNLSGYEQETCKADENNSDLASKNTHVNEDIKTNEINNEENDTYSKERMPRHKGNLKKIASKEPCSKHIGSEIEFYCEADEELCCCICVRSDHSCCKSVKRIADIAHSFSESNDYRNTMKSLDFVVEMGKSFESQLRESYVAVEEYRSKTRRRILEYKHEINALFDKLERDILSKINSKQKDDTNELESLHQRISTMLFEVQAIKELIHTVRLKSDENYQLFISVKKLNKKMNSCFEDIKCMKQKNLIHGYEFKADEKIEKLIGGDITNLGELCMKTPETPAAKLISETRVIKLRSKSVTVGSVHRSRDSACRITGMVATKSALIIVDNANCMIKIFSIKDSTKLDQKRFSRAPYDVTLIAETEIALTFPDEEEVKMTSIIKEGKRDRSLNTQCACKNVCFIDNRKLLVVTVRGSDNILLLDIYGRPCKPFLFTGSRLKNIDIVFHAVKGRITYRKSTPAWSTSTQVKDDLMLGSGREGFILARTDNAIVCAFDYNGQEDWTFGLKCVLKAIATDEDGTMYVASPHQSDMKPVTTIESHTTPWYTHRAEVTRLANSPLSCIQCEKMNVSCMVYCKDMYQLFVAADDEIRVFPVL